MICNTWPSEYSSTSLMTTTMQTNNFIKPIGKTCSVKRSARPATVHVDARSTKKGKQDAGKQKQKKQGLLSQFTDAIDFAQTRSEDDRNLIDTAKLSLGKKPKQGEERQKMSKEQYQALRRKVGGTARDYWKDFVEADEVKGYKDTGGSNVPGLPFLIAVVAGLIVATVVVTSQTGADPASQTSSATSQQTAPAASPSE